MFCPKCGYDCGDAKFCPECGTDLRTINIAPSGQNQSADNELDLNSYFERFHPNRIAAIKALVADTGMGLREAKDLIDAEFNEKQKQLYSSDPAAACQDLKRAFHPKKAAFEEEKDALEKSGKVYCPKCHSTSVSAQKNGFGFVRGAVGAAVGLDVGLIAGGLGANKVKLVCMKCGYTWKPGKK